MRCAAVFKHGDEIEELPVQVSNDLDGRFELQSIRFHLENLQGLAAEGSIIIVIGLL